MPETQTHKDAYRSGGPGFCMLTTITTMALNLLGFLGHGSKGAGFAPVANDIHVLLLLEDIRPKNIFLEFLISALRSSIYWISNLKYQ